MFVEALGCARLTGPPRAHVCAGRPVARMRDRTVFVLGGATFGLGVVVFGIGRPSIRGS